MSVFPNGNNPPTGAHRVTQHHPMFGRFIIEKKKKPENGEAGDKLLLPAQMPVGQLKI
jgi:hypothetical protein